MRVFYNRWLSHVRLLPVLLTLTVHNQHQGDGGKWVCGMHTQLKHQRIVYSFGSNYQVCKQDDE